MHYINLTVSPDGDTARPKLSCDPLAIAAALPTREVIHQLATQFQHMAATQVFLSFIGVNGLRFAGCLVSRSSIHRPIGFCPISSDLVIGSALWRSDVIRQLSAARSIAEDPINATDVAIRFDALRQEGRDVPAWVYALACVPIQVDWDGGLVYPVPFCPTRFEIMSRQPQASRWFAAAAARREN